MNPVLLEDFCNFKYLSNIAFSPEGKSACFVVTESDLEKNDYKSNIYLRADGSIRKLTSGNKEGSFFYYDENTVMFTGNRDDSKEKSSGCKVYKIRIDGGEAELAFKLPVSARKFIPLPNGDLLVVGTVFPEFEDLYKGSPKLIKEFQDHRKENEDYEIVDKVPWWFNGAGFIKDAYASLYYYDIKKNRLTLLTEKGIDISNAELSPDKKSVYYARRDASPALSNIFNGMEICRMDLESREETPVIKSKKKFNIEGFALGETFMLVIAHDESLGLNTDPDFYKVDYKTGRCRKYCDFKQSIGSSVGSDIRYGGGQSAAMRGDAFYFISTQFDSANIYKLENGVIAPVTETKGSVDSFDVFDGHILATGLLNMGGQELFDEGLNILSSFNKNVLKGKYVAHPEKLNFMSEGEEIHGFVLKPINFDSKKKYPVILDVHGGPKTVYGDVYYHEMQYWAGKGYFVIFCNPKGSDGRGDFCDIFGKYGTIDYEQIMQFCDEALKAYPQMDKDNMFETGGSYGGFMTNWIIGHTDRFKACASQRSISNWISFYGVSDIGVRFAPDQIKGEIWPDPKKLWQHSPLKYADKVKTPTLFIHSFEDYRCPIEQGYQMYTALIAHGVDSKMVLFKGENHELSRSGKPKHRIKRLTEITEWFEKYKDK